VKIGPLNLKFDVITTTVSGLYVFGFGMYRAKFDNTSGFYQPQTCSPLWPTDLSRDRFWIKGPVYRSIWLPSVSTATTLTALSCAFNLSDFILNEGESLKFVIGGRFPLASTVGCTYSGRFKQRRLL
jgi:hypothetical protein